MSQVTKRSVKRSILKDERAEEAAKLKEQVLAVNFQVMAIRLYKDADKIYELAGSGNLHAVELVAASESLQSTIAALGKDATVDDKTKSIAYKKCVRRLLAAATDFYASGVLSNEN